MEKACVIPHSRLVTCLAVAGRMQAVSGPLLALLQAGLAIIQ